MLDRAREIRAMAGNVLTVWARETHAYFDSPIAYVYAAVFVLLAHGIFMNEFFLASVLEMDEYFRVLPYLLTLFIPAITMRAWAEERAQGTFELIMTLPLRCGELVSGKYLAALTFYLAVLASSVPIVVMLLALGRPDLGLVAGSYLGAVLLGSMFLALGIFVSGLTREQIVAFVVGVFACAVLVLSGHARVVEVLDGLAPAWQAGTWLAESVSVLPHYESFCRGVVSVADVAFFVLSTGCLLIMNVMTLKLGR
jgi:ABC-2 type transport system permease protein